MLEELEPKVRLQMKLASKPGGSRAAQFVARGRSQRFQRAFDQMQQTLAVPNIDGDAVMVQHTREPIGLEARLSFLAKL